MDSVKICFVTREYAHVKMGQTGGIGVFLKKHTEQLKTYNFKITVFSFGVKPVQFNDNGVAVIKIKDLSSFNSWLKEPFKRYNIPGYISLKLFLEFLNRLYVSIYLSLFVKRRKFDIVEFHDYGGDAPYFMSKKPKIVRCHGSALTLHQFMGYVNRISDSIFEKQFFSRFQQNVLAVSKYSAFTTHQTFKLKALPKVIYNGVTIPKTTHSKAYMDEPTLPYSVFYFGAIRERKGIDIACKAFNAIVTDFPEATFHVLGNNNNNYWNTHAKLILSKNAQDRTTYYGTVPNSEVNDYLQKAHVVLFPSYGENFSIALLEVMALGRLVITSNIPAFQEIIKPNKNGFIANEEKDYYSFLQQIFNNVIPTNEISKLAVSTVKNSFEIQDITKQNIDFYKSLLN